MPWRFNRSRHCRPVPVTGDCARSAESSEGSQPTPRTLAIWLGGAFAASTTGTASDDRAYPGYQRWLSATSENAKTMFPSAPWDTNITLSTRACRNRSTALDICDVCAPKSWMDWKHWVSYVDATVRPACRRVGARPFL